MDEDEAMARAREFLSVARLRSSHATEKVWLSMLLTLKPCLSSRLKGFSACYSWMAVNMSVFPK